MLLAIEVVSNRPTAFIKRNAWRRQTKQIVFLLLYDYNNTQVQKGTDGGAL